MEHCKTCKHWEPWGNGLEGYCKLVSSDPSSEGYEVPNLDLPMRIEVDNPHYSLETTAEFGCVLWAENS